MAGDRAERQTVWKGVAAAVFVAGTGYGSYLVLGGMAGQGELGDKAGWAALQGVERQTRGRDCGAVEIREAGGGAFLAIGFPASGAEEGGAAGSSCRSWVLLNEHDPDRTVKQMPRFSAYRLPCSQVARLEAPPRGADGYVLDHLRTICTPRPPLPTVAAMPAR